MEEYDLPEYNLRCHNCSAEINGPADLGGSVTFSFGMFPLCVKCAEY